MSRLTRSTSIKTVLKQALLAVGMAALPTGLQGVGAAAATQQLWSIVVHLRYVDGFEFDYVLERGVAASNLGAALAECGRSHQTSGVVTYHCYPVAE